MVNLEHIVTKGFFLTVVSRNGNTKQYSKNRRKSNVQKYIFSNFQEGASLHLQVRAFMTYGSLTQKIHQNVL